MRPGGGYTEVHPYIALGRRTPYKFALQADLSLQDIPAPGNPNFLAVLNRG